MTDPRKPVFRPDIDANQQFWDSAQAQLLKLTEQGAQAMGCTGVSFVLMGMSIWTSELTELDSKAATQLLRSLADLYDPNTNDTGKARAEKKRRSAVNRIFAAVDLDMSKPAGSA